jgi:hypothetical protein
MFLSTVIAISSISPTSTFAGMVKSVFIASFSLLKIANSVHELPWCSLEATGPPRVREVEVTTGLPVSDRSESSKEMKLCQTFGSDERLAERRRGDGTDLQVTTGMIWL